MPPRPLHRWKSFWIGVLVLIFLGWAWVRSTHHFDHIYYTVSTTRWGAGTDSGAVVLIWYVDPFALDGLDFISVKPDWKSSWFPEAIQLVGGRTEGLQYFTISLWFLILLFLVPWAGFLFWRVRRVKRLAGSSTQDPAP